MAKERISMGINLRLNKNNRGSFGGLCKKVVKLLYQPHNLLVGGLWQKGFEMKEEPVEGLLRGSGHRQASRPNNCSGVVSRDQPQPYS